MKLAVSLFAVPAHLLKNLMPPVLLLQVSEQRYSHKVFLLLKNDPINLLFTP